jgi:hypothetical protein
MTRTLALEVFESIVNRRDELRGLDARTPAEAEELGIAEELVAALAGSNDGHAVARHAAELLGPAPGRFLQ